ncbi:hypothetical protein DLAC_07797 [Tieghemostelium lacteum]|uniref:EGF-like domain-containing protein n=1 Tax=Tieghemostelium lacteum TaxID=361077 RepID=A0A151ZAE7_TIELA|nr:hypothetical protein DLAC_07797 [Tieghemostelium lacteum]|eukprot:KYQ90922.1 hypothetical protein DLAC_07797 [Tieghemostelium lacteum]
MKEIYSYLLVLLFILNSSNVNAITSNQKTFLNSIATACSFTWAPSGADCGSYVVGTNTKVTCNPSTAEVTELYISPSTKYCSAITDSYNLFPQLTKLTIGYNLSSSATIQTHPNVQYFKFESSDPAMVFTFLPSFNMTSLTSLDIMYPAGTFPTNLNTSMVNLRIYGHPTLGKFTSHFPSNLFTPSLKTFFFILFFTPTPAYTLPANVFTNSPNIVEYQVSIPGYTLTDLTSFYNPPLSLLTIGIYTFNAPTVVLPTFEEAGWQNLVALVIAQCGLKGSIPQNYFQQKALLLLNFGFNSQLQVPLNYLATSKLQQLFIANTATSGTVPDDMLDGALQRFDARGTALNGVLPPCFMCLPNSALSENPAGYQYLFDSNKFSNYQGVSSPRVCNPVITSISPTLLKTTDFYFVIQGTSLGSIANYLQISMTNSVGDTFNLAGYCTAKKKSKTIECLNPNVQGSGNVTLIVFNDQNPVPIVTKAFSYVPPTVSFVSSPSTLGGAVTIYGDNLMGTNYGATNITIGSNLCSPVNIILPNAIVSCQYPSGVTSDLPVKVMVKNQVNDYQNQAKFFYKPPSITSFIYIKPNTEAQLTILGADFWNDLSLVSVKIESTDCTMVSVNNTILVCNYPKTPFTAGAKNVQVTVNNRVSYPNNLFEFIDQSYCPSSCSNGGNCNRDLGVCICNEGFAGPACDQVTMLTEQDIDDSLPILTATRDDPSNTRLQVQILSVFEDNSEVDLTDSSSWTMSEGDKNVNIYQYQDSNRQLIVTITSNPTFSSAQLGTNTITYPNGSYTYSIEYSSSSVVNDLRFKFQMEMTPEECESPPYIYAYPTGVNYGSHFMTLLKYNSQWHARFPQVTVLNGGKSYSTIATEPQNKFGNYTQVIAKVQSSQVQSTYFQYDFSLLDTYQSREPIVEGCGLEEVKQNNSWKIAVGIAVPVGVALLATAGFFIFKQQRKINETNKLLNQKLSELSKFRD